MTKRLLFFLTIITQLLGQSVYAIDVKTADELIGIFTRASHHKIDDDIILLNDISFSGVNLPFPLGADSNGCKTKYGGFLQGNGHSIKDLQMDNSEKEGYNHAGLFCGLDGARIENVIIDSSCSFGGNFSGGFSATASGSLTITNSINKANVSGFGWVGGFIGHLEEMEKEKVVATFDGCVNEGSISFTETSGGAGGFVGSILGMNGMKVIFSSSTNNGSVSENGNGFVYLGGFVGKAIVPWNNECVNYTEFDYPIENMTLFINNCTNHAFVNGKDASSGGFLGGASCNLKIDFKDSLNSGFIQGTYASGFLSHAAQVNSISFYNCFNDGDISFYGESGEIFSGFVSLLFFSENGLKIENCQNNGKILGRSPSICGGLVGYSLSSMTITNCLNHGIVNGSSAGGLVGSTDQQVFKSREMTVEMTNCTNVGTVISSSRHDFSIVGGLIGGAGLSGSYGTLIIDNCTEKGIITSYSNTGGIGGMIGWLGFAVPDSDNDDDDDDDEFDYQDVTNNNQVTIISSIVEQNITMECEECAVGGAIGNITSVDPLKRNSVSVSVTGNQEINVSCSSCFVGGIIGTVNETSHTSVAITNTIIHGSLNTISQTNVRSAAGGFVGSALNNNKLSLSITDSENDCIISSERVDKVGGIIGTYSNNKNVVEGAKLEMIHIENKGKITSSDSSIVGGLVGFIFNIETISVSDCKNNASMTIDHKKGTNSVFGGLIGSFTDTMNVIINPTITLKNCENHGSLTITSSGSMIVGGIVGSVHDAFNSTVNMIDTTNIWDLIQVETKSCHIGGLIGNVTNNGAIKMVFDNCSNKAFIGSTSHEDNHEGGFIGKMNDNAKYTLDISDCTNSGDINGSGQDNYVGGFIGSVGRNRDGRIHLKNTINLGSVTVNQSNSQSYLGGGFGSVEKNPVMDFMIDSSYNFGNIKNCEGCQAVSGGLCGWVDLVNDGTQFSMIVSNSMNNGSVTNTIGSQTTSCGLFCVSGKSKLHENIQIQLFNSVNKGTVAGSSSYGITTTATDVNNVVSMGKVNGDYSDIVIYSKKFTYNNIYYLKGSCSKTTGRYTMFEEKSGQFIANGKRVCDELNQQAMSEQYGMVWDQNLNIQKGLTVYVGHPVNDNFIVAINTTMKQFRGIFDKIGKFFDYWLVNKNTQQEMTNSTRIKNHEDVLLCHKVSISGELSNVFYVENNTKLSSSVPHFPEKFLKTYYKFYTSQDEFNYQNTITEDMNLTIKSFCGNMDKDTCKRFSSCMWIGKSCEEKRRTIPVIVVCCFAALACIGAATFVVVTKFCANRDYSPINGGVFMTVKIPINGKSTNLILHDEIGRGRFGIVYHAQAKGTDSQYAVKIVQTTDSQESDYVDKEYRVMEQLDSRFVVAVYGSVCTETSMAIAMEYFPLGSLQRVLQDCQLSQDVRVAMLLDTAKAMEYLHSQNLIHRDLKPGNVLVCSIDPNVHPMLKFVVFLTNARK